MYKVFLLFSTFWLFAPQVLAQNAGGARGVDFRMQFVSGNLDFTSVSGVKRKFSGFGSELQTSLYLVEKTRFRTSIFISSRVMTWTGLDVLEAEYDDVQTFSVAPGLELHYGPLFLQASSTRMNANAYNISSTSKGKQLIIEGPCVSAGFNWKFGSLGIGIGASQMSLNVPGARLGLSEDSKYVENSYSLNLIYYMGMTPRRFFNGLFK
jgi:hypothetical protein